MRGAAIFLLCSVACGTAYALQGDAQQPINIRARQVEANEKTGVSTYRGNVVLAQGSLRVEADRLEVTLRDGSTDVVRAWGDPVRMQTRTDEGETLSAKAQRLTYRAGSRRIELREGVELTRGADVFTGATVVYALDDHTFRAEGNGDGRVSVVIQPAKQQEKP